MDKEEIVRIIDQFINENGLWNQFKEWVEEQGYSLAELGFKE